jgi:geranylgeranyl diphosphate synthase type I
VSEPIPRADTDVEDAASVATKWLETVKAQIDARLGRWFEQKTARAAGIHQDSKVLVETVAELSGRGGKRIRPCLVVAGFYAVAPEEELEAVLDASIAVELLHTYLLIQDDWMDHDDTRRGGPAAHAELGRRFEDPHKGNAAAILAADLACAWAWQALVEAPILEERLQRAFDEFTRMQEDVVYGQLLDVLGRGDVETIHLLKTAGYTVQGPLRIGGHIAGAAEDALGVLDGYGRPLGLAFQLRDDLLGTFGDPAETGKPTGSDLREGKRTALIHEAESVFNDEQKAKLKAVLGNKSAPDAEVEEVRALLESTGVRANVERKLGGLHAEALTVLDESELSPVGKLLLRGLGGLIVHRKS